MLAMERRMSRLRREHRLDRSARELPQVLEELAIEGVGHRDPERPTRPALQREEHVALREGPAHRATGQRHVELERIDLPVGQPGGEGGGLGDAILVEQVAPVVERDLEGGHDLHRGDLVARRLLALDPALPQHPGARGVLLDQHVLALGDGDQATGDERLEDEPRAEVGAAAGDGAGAQGRDLRRSEWSRPSTRQRREAAHRGGRAATAALHRRCDAGVRLRLERDLRHPDGRASRNHHRRRWDRRTGRRNHSGCRPGTACRCCRADGSRRPDSSGAHCSPLAQVPAVQSWRQ